MVIDNNHGETEYSLLRSGETKANNNKPVWVTQEPMPWFKLRGTDIWIMLTSYLVSFVLAVFCLAIVDSVVQDDRFTPDSDVLPYARVVIDCIAGGIVFIGVGSIMGVSVAFLRRGFSRLMWGAQYIIGVFIISQIISFMMAATLGIFSTVVLKSIADISDLLISLVLPTLVYYISISPILTFMTFTLTRHTVND